jgi:catechol 2,3-dioxygenase
MAVQTPTIAPATAVGAVELSVADLTRSLAYYRRALGLSVLEEEEGRVSLGAGGTELLRLVEVPGAQPAPQHTGLFHFALLLPDRTSLARWFGHAVRDRVPLSGASDHAVSEAIYLRDPDYHGIEIYADRPRETWEGRVGRLMTTRPLDADDLLGELDDPDHELFDGLPGGTRMGHVHLQVADVNDAVAFYRDVLGLELMAQLGDEAAFLAAGGYHHHLGANTWNSAGASPPPPGSAALRHATIVLPDDEERDRVVARVADAGRDPQPRDDGVLVRDPSENALLLVGAR